MSSSFATFSWASKSRLGPSSQARIAPTGLLQRPFVQIVLLSLLCGLLFFFGLNAGELYRTESLRAIIAAEFLRSGDWIVPRLYGEPLFTKPPGMYAAIALVSWPLGEVTEWSARLPSALAATSIVFLFYWSVGRNLGRRAGFLAAAMAPVSLMWLDKSTAAEIDMLQVAWVTAANLCFFRALEEEEDDRSTPTRRFHWWLLALLAVCGGTLTKWTAPAYFYGAVVALLWWRGRLGVLRRWPHVLSAILAASLCWTWIAAAVWSAGWNVFYDTVSREALQRLSPAHHIRPYPWRESLLHPIMLWAANLPCSALALATLWPSFSRGWDERALRLLQGFHCWLWPNLLFWSAIPEHASRHSFPMAPAIAGLAAFTAVAWIDGKWQPPRWARRIAPIPLFATILFLWLGAKAAFVHGVIPSRNQFREPRNKAARIAAHVPRDSTLYLFHLKDEGIMFYYGRRVLRLPAPTDLPRTHEPLYCILEESEWLNWNSSRPAEILLRLRDEQQAPIVLAKVDR